MIDSCEIENRKTMITRINDLYIFIMDSMKNSLLAEVDPSKRNDTIWAYAPWLVGTQGFDPKRSVTFPVFYEEKAKILLAEFNELVNLYMYKGHLMTTWDEHLGQYKWSKKEKKMPNSCKCILKKMVFKGAMSQKEYDKIIRNLKSSQWIPVTEMLPEEPGMYIITGEYTSSGTKSLYVDICEYGRPYTYPDGYDQPDVCFYFDDEDVGPIEIENVIAWMPLPEPYKKEEEDADNSQI